jgi:hypothetical protein
MELRMRKEIAVGAAMVLGVGAQAMAAEGFSYSHVEAGFVHGKTHIDPAPHARW